MSLGEYSPYLDWIDSQAQHMVFLTEVWSRINSGSYHVSGVRRFKQALADNFLWLGGQMRDVPMAPYVELDAAGQEITREIGEALVITQRPDAPIQLLLVGHMDTVFAVDHPFQTPRFVSETVMNGPGVADLKGGLVVMLKALEAFERSPWAHRVGYQIVFNPDEEIGAISSDALLKEAAAGKMLGLIYEPSLPEGSLAGARKGSGNFSLRVQGKAAHAGRNPNDGRNAIVCAGELAQILFSLNDARPGLRVNPAKIDGGGPSNMVPDMAVLRFNVRLETPEDMDWFSEKIEEIIESFRHRDGFAISLHGGFTRPPKPMSAENARVFDFVQSTSRLLGIELGITPSGGCCDGHNLWRYGLPNVDTLGVRGANIHSDAEIVYLESLPERARLSALLLMRLARGELGPA